MNEPGRLKRVADSLPLHLGLSEGVQLLIDALEELERRLLLALRRTREPARIPAAPDGQPARSETGTGTTPHQNWK